ncbi:MAG: U32 family peptidase [Clostridia bacterium]|nr:U32 family peptidase [Clostridia bacterium]
MYNSKRLHSRSLPELLCPAGSPDALRAAIDGGADAVYLGGGSFHARMNADNFGTPRSLADAVSLAHFWGVKVYVTLNTMVYDRELEAALAQAEQAANAGADALIVADVGLAALLHRALPELPLHASTQMSIHRGDAGRLLADAGFSRMVVAREMPADQIAQAVKESPIEVEAFVHGALCVSQSGQCLFSSLVGGRSGNRGQCAQPCRLPFKDGKGKDFYPLSLKDLSLARYVPEMIESGVASLKIEGRMKSPEYVHTVTRIWRALLDAGKGADEQQMAELGKAFSRGGFTDGYYRRRKGEGMLGVRSAEDKVASGEIQKFRGIQRKIPIEMSASLQADQPMALTARAGEHIVCVQGACPEAAHTRPVTAEQVQASLAKLGATPFVADTPAVQIEGEVMVAASALNALRREAAEGLERVITESLAPAPVVRREIEKPRPEGVRDRNRTARFLYAHQLTESAAAYFDIRYLPLELIANRDVPLCNGAVLPPVIFPEDTDKIREMLGAAAAKGIRHLMVGNIGHLEMLKGFDFVLHGDYRLNAANNATVCELERYGFADVFASAEMSVAQLRDLGGNTAAIVYGRVPLMTLERCVNKQAAGCAACTAGKAQLIDRKGVKFPVVREYGHRNLVLNSLPTGMSDKQSALTAGGIVAQHYMFTVESAAEVDRVISAYQKGTALPYPVRRI